MIRPSLLPLAERCGHAVQLAEENPESSDAAERGTGFHQEADAHIRGIKASDRVSRMIATFPAHIKIESERRVALLDDDGAVLSEGTTDVTLTHVDQAITVVDWKTGMPDKVSEPDENLQILVYGLAAAIERGSPRFRVGLYFTDHPPLRLSQWIDTADAGWIVDRVRNAIARDRSVPVVGSHCSSCYRRTHCRAWLLPAQQGEAALAPFASPGGLTVDTAPKALHVIQAMEDAIKVAKARLQDFARENGGIRDGGRIWGPTWSRGGRTSVDLDAVPDVLMDQLRQAGALKQGRPYEVFRWKNAGKADGNEHRDTSRER